MRFILNQEHQPRHRYLIKFNDAPWLEVPPSRVEVLAETTGDPPDFRGVLPAEIRAYRVWRKEGTYLDVDPADMLVVDQ